MRFSMVPVLLAQMFKKPFTNKFPVKYTPSSPTRLMERVNKGEVRINPPVQVPERFRGKISYDKDKCIGCKLCLQVCPSAAIEYKTEEKKIKIYLARCTFCSQCNDVCPVSCLSMSNEFLLSDTDKYSKDLIVE
ncbi:MAG: 4Fe-4S dicluster domain-containing protein [Candidatus Thermoplasmatota archaeon]